MPLVNAKCTNCGGTLTVDASKDAAICDFCGSPFIVEKAIQNYNYHITNNITAQNVIITGKGEMEKERLLQNAKTQLDFKDYATARSIFQEVSTDYPDDYRAWYGMASIDTEEFTKVDLSAAEFQQICSLMDKALMTAAGQKTEIEAEWKIYLAKHLDFLKQKKEELALLENQLNEAKANVGNSNMIIQQNKSNIKQLNESSKGSLIRVLLVASGVISYFIGSRLDQSREQYWVSSSILLFLVAVLSFIISKAKISKYGTKIINYTFVVLILSTAIFLFLGLSSSHSEKFSLVLASIVLSITTVTFKIIGSAKLAKTKNANNQMRNNIDEASTNINMFNQTIDQSYQRINELKSRYNI